MIRFAVLPLAAGLALLAAAPALAAQPVTGRWVTKEGKALVQIAPCGKQLCGQILRVLRAAPEAPRTDLRNPDPALRRRPIEGLTILSDFTDRGGEWRGRIYDPQSGKTYAARLSRNADGTLKVQGCVAIFCQSQTWTAAR